ncbi:MAG: hypothetical protein V8R64_06730 [Thomasclavelia sp.]
MLFAIVNEINPILAVLLAIIAGFIAGAITGILHTKCQIPAILAGILTQIGLYSINLRIMGGRANPPLITSKDTYLQRFIKYFKYNHKHGLL